MTTTFLFGDNIIATAKSGRSSYAHTFGGPHDRKGTSRKECRGILIHLLHRFDLNDPALPLTIPGIRWLPIYYCFDFRANTLGYQLHSDDLLITFFPTDDSHVTKREEWPDEHYPLIFPKSDIAIGTHEYDPTNLEDAYEWAGIFGVGKLSASDQMAAKARVAEEMELWGSGAPETEEDYQKSLSRPFMQGKPSGGCLNPKCSNYKESRSLSTIALMPAEPVEGIHTLGRWGRDVKLIVQICYLCYTFRVSNECT